MLFTFDTLCYSGPSTLIQAQWALIFWIKIHSEHKHKPCVYLFIFGKNPSCVTITTCVFIKFGIFGLNFLIFLPKIPLLFFLFSCQFDLFSPFLYCLVNLWICQHKLHCAFIIILVFFPTRVFIPSWALLFGWSSSLCVYSSLSIY